MKNVYEVPQAVVVEIEVQGIIADSGSTGEGLESGGGLN